MIKAICFDLDGMYFTAESFKKFRSKLAVNTSEEKAIEVLNTSDEMAAFKAGELSEGEFWAYAITELKLEMNEIEIFATLRECYEENPRVKEMVLKAREMGYKTCICSNNNITRIRELEYKFGFLQNFDFAIFSFEVGTLKPDPAIFQELITRTGLKAEEIVYADDNADKLKGAQELGITCFTFSDATQFQTELTKLGINL